MNLRHIDSEKILFLDIETIRSRDRFSELDSRGQALWKRKTAKSHPEADPEDTWHEASLWAEFARVVCISAGLLCYEEGRRCLRVKNFSGKDERKLLGDFSALLSTYYSRKDQYLCAHNGKGFDFPFLCRRLLILGLEIPEILDISGKKPWETGLIDSMELWKFGHWQSHVSLDTLAWVFGIPSPKDDIDGSDVGRVFWEEDNLDRIASYCNKDVVTLTQVFLRMKGEKAVPDENLYINGQPCI